MKPSSARHRVDSVAKALVAHAKALGVECAPLGGTVDYLLWWGNVTRLVDFKSHGTPLTESQSKLVGRGCPIHFVSTPQQLEALVAAMMREARA